jgi:hypothetical protein
MNAKITTLLNQIIISTGCDKQTAILILIRGFINEGLPASEALNLVCGSGATAAIAGETWEALQAA